MLTQTKEVRDAWRASQRTLDIKVAVNGKTYTATDINSLKYDSGAYTGDTFAIGSTYSNSVQIEFSHLIENLKLGMEVLPSIGIKTSSGYVYEPLGVFIISSEIKMDRNNNLTSISASDRFCGLEGSYKSKLAYPAKVLDVIAEICEQSGVKANVDDLARLPHQADLPRPITGQTYRKALGWIAQLYAGYATFDRKGLFTIRTIAEPNYELDPSQYEQAGLTKNEAPYRISGIQCQTTITTKTRDGEDTDETKNYQVGDTNGSQIKLENNIMTPDRLTNIWEQIKDVNFYPFSLNWFGNPAIEAGDWLKLQDKQGNKFIVPNNSYTLDFNGGLSATSKADQTSSTDSVIAWEGTFSQTIRELQGRKAPDGTVIFPPSVTEPPTNAKPNDVWFKQNGNSTELWVFTEQEDGTRKWIRRDLTPDEIKKQVQEAQDGLKDAKKEIADNLAKADKDIAELNESINNQKGSLDGLSTTVNTVVIPKVTDVTNQVSDAIKKVNEQKNIVTGLQNQAIQQGKDISKITSDVHGVTVDLANLNGDVNQTKATVQGLQSTLGNAQGDIAQIKVDAKKLETSLSGKVDNSTYATFVNQTNQALNAKLIASDLNGYAKTTDLQATANGLQFNINSVTDKLNNLRIGGRNLVGGTDKEYVMGFGIPNTVWKDNFAYISLPLISGDGGEILPQGAGFWHVLSPGEEYTQTIWIETDAIIKSLNGTFLTWLTMDDGHDVQKAYIQRIGNNSYKIVGSYTWPQNKKGNRVRLFDIFSLPNSIDLKSGTYLKFGKLKLEVGNASTDWTPAVEDTEHDLESLSARITINSQQFGSYYTKGESDNRTNTAKNEVINSIKNDSNWHGLTNILTNSGFIQTADGFIQKVQQTMQPIINENNSGGVNLLTNTYTLRNFNNAGNAGEATGFEIDSGDSHKNELNAGEISTNVFHVYAKDLNHAPVYFGQNFTLPKGTWTLSFLVRHNGSSEQKIRLSFYTDDCANRGWIPLGTSDEIDNIWKRHQITFTTTQEIFEQNPRVHMPTDDIVPGGSLYFANFKLESGSIATTWCPAPEDLAKQVAVTELGQTIKGLQSTVSSNYGNLQSQISQTAGTIRNEITDRTNNLQSQITQNANNISIKVNAVGDLSNICLNPTFIDGSTEGWENVFSSSGDPGSPTKFYGGVNTRNAFYGNMFSVAAGDKYFFSVFAWQNQSTNPLNIGFTYLQKDGTWNWQSAINFAPNEGARTKSGSITIPKEAVKARIWVEIDSFSNFGNWWFTNLIVRKNDTISQINMSAGTTLIQNDKIYMDASSTVFSGKAFIPDAAITNISADKINTGTLDAGRINVINLNANNITTGTIKGQNSSFNLTDGTLTALNQYNEGVFMRNGKLEFTSRQSWNNNSTATYGYIQSLPKMFALGYNYGGLDINGTSGFVLHNDKTKIKTSNSGQSGSAVEGGSYIFGSDGLTSINNENSVIINAGAQSYSEWTAGISLLSGNASRNVPPSITLGSSNSLNDRSTVTISGSLAVLGSKNAAVRTSQGLRAINAYETAEYYFGDIGRAKTNSNGAVCIYMDPLFLETVNTGVPYHIFLTSYSEARIWVSEMYPSYFVIRSDKPNADFVWEIKAKRKGYENDRLKIIDQEKKVNE
ncbi:hypothetical protein [Lactobacillus johnsonii]|uniref:Lj965 prophage protein n=1 Tax=Lactobacillus johnsonii (strain CNCM I-12250 / La1 / NCC 533) TaxID=257314 RepID=Q65PS9_LACJO|nr:hypothetical protein [Lactobacillus johnsonii]NP_958595.1 hypothetical protein Ljo_0324 [Lactobacillus prophage Lj965]AAK27911.2 putative protein [Lactobacillus prophage Lj965]AAS08310.1 Lj965 prophage protein [Lactobacillus prophage Lj965] [Lactobacillus johnsonii NCC 533]MCT3322027.1 hypothetical protein [Lactobacillus johnsonii]MCT3341014.1 hypothetical protein [Lactobacillus johnsonii]MCT3389276.1 hypothetical protein [Lactobacillus johnsonii]